MRASACAAIICAMLALAGCATQQATSEAIRSNAVDEVDLRACLAADLADHAKLVREHLYGGAPSSDAMLVRRAYVTAYDRDYRTPKWTAWHVTGAYRDTPTRTGRWESFRVDPEVPNPVQSSDYDGLRDKPGNYVRGHIAPYFIAGGDRDGDGKGAAGADHKTLLDTDDACTVYEINLMTNVAPQSHDAFNGAGGSWYRLETTIRALVGRGEDLHVIGGSIYGPAPKRVGPNGGVAVPDMFFQIVISGEGVTPFLFLHNRRLVPEGCDLKAKLETCITTIAVIEAVSGLDFFSALTDEARLEAGDGRKAWARLTGAAS